MIRAIETRYKGYRFRSRLEARWAVFFDALMIDFRYEHEGYTFQDGTMYLPDFDISTAAGRSLFEIKSENGDDSKSLKFVKELEEYWSNFLDDYHREGTPEYTGLQIVKGDPLEVLLRAEFKMCPRCLHIGDPACGWDDEYGIGCETCDFTTPGGGGHPWEVSTSKRVYVTPHKGLLEISPSPAAWRSFVRNAAEVARSARFEYGECGAMA